MATDRQIIRFTWMIFLIINNNRMMKNIKYISVFFFTLVLGFTSCQDDDTTFGAIVVPTNVTITTEIVGLDGSNPNGDGTGLVNFIATANNEITYKFDFGDGFSNVSPTGVITHRFTTVGVNTYTVVVSAVGTGGISSSTAVNVEVLSTFDDPETRDFLSGGTASSKTWYWAADKAGNIGLGPNEVQADGSHTFAAWFSSDAFHSDKLCMYNAQMVFMQDAEGNLTFEQTVGDAYVPGSYADILGVDGDACHGADVVPSLGGVKNVSLAPSSSIATEDAQDPEYKGTTINFSDGGFMSWYIGSSSFEIISITNSTLSVRVGQPGFAWYCNFQTQDPNASESFNTLVWSDEFETNGAPDPANWTYDLGAGGWGNGEAQTYTNNAENVIVEDGMLKIIAKADGSGGYTSARLKSEKLFEFTYGKVEVRAKLPVAQGTWPAIWMLGANFDTEIWPACGEIDIMEQTGQDKTRTSGALHFPDNSGGEALTDDTANATSTTEFHNYAVEWTEESIKLSVDGDFFFSFDNTSGTPYNLDFFMILNIAMGGNLGGTIDPAFTEDVMEIDYVRVYQ